MKYPSRRLQFKVFATCWLVLALHFATDIVREHYLSFSLAEDYSFRMDKYLGLHVDIFDTPGHGAHIGNNPGASMLGAIPYWVFRPIIDRVVAGVNARKGNEPVSAVYDDPRPRRVEFYKRVRERGLDVQFGLASGVIHLFLMAPASAAMAVVLLRVLTWVGLPGRLPLLFSFAYVLATPVFFRTAFLNQNLLIAHFVLLGFLALWRPAGRPAWSDESAVAFAGFMGGLSVLNDYSGLVVLGWFGLHSLWVGWRSGGLRGAFRLGVWNVAGALAPVLLLLFYQWRSFGSPWYPGQHYMPPVDWIDIGYKGVGFPEWKLFSMLLFDLRFGLFVACPLLMAGVVGALMVLRRPTWLPRPEALSLAGFTLAFLVFFSMVQYTQLQWVTGIRYIVPVIPCLFLLAVPLLQRLPTHVLFVVMVFAFAEAWCMAMVRGIYIHDSVARIFLGGFQLPWMNVLVKMAPQYFPFMAQVASPLPLFALCGVMIWGLWALPDPEAA